MRKMLGLCLLLSVAWACNAGSPSASEGRNAAYENAATTEPTAAATEEAPDNTPPEQRDVLYYFKRLKTPYFPVEYALRQVNGKWTCLSPSTQEPLEGVVVDTKNGFIEIVDPGTGGGDWTFRVVLFRMADGNPLLGITHTFFDGATLRHEYYFLKPEDSRQLDWTKQVIKQVSAFDFLPPDNAEESAIVEKLLPVSLELPRYGTMVKARVYTGLKDIYCRGDENEFSDYCGLFGQVRRTEIAFKWDKEKGRFFQQ